MFLGVPDAIEHRAEHHGTPQGTLSVPNKYLKILQEHAEHREHPKIQVPALELPNLWQAELAQLHAAKPLQGYDPNRWRQLLEDARWLADQQGQAAVALGWTASDLFGLDDTLDGWGGLADRLQGARRVNLTDKVARWRSDELDGWLWRQTLPPMRTLWDVAKG